VATISVPALLFGKRAIASIDEQGNNTIANDTNMAATTATTTGITGPTIGNSTSQRVAVGGGNMTTSINQFSPQTVQIQSGEVSHFCT
jgi:hypothetical protein